MRELENILERAYTLCDDNQITCDDLQLTSNGQATSTTNPEKDTELHGESLDHHLEDIEREIIVKALDESKWNRTAAAKKLGLTFRSLRYRLKKLNLDE